MTDKQSEIALLKDKEGGLIDGQVCLVTSFQPLMGSTVENGIATSPNASMPYAEVKIECQKGKYTGYITHKEDFINLWEAFKVRGADEEKEVLMFWTTKKYTNILFKFSPSVFLPKILVMICEKYTYKSHNTFSWYPNTDALEIVFIASAVSWWIPAALTNDYKRIIHIG